MIKLFYLTLTAFLTYLMLTTGAHAVTDMQYQSITRMGELNGIALHCGYMTRVNTIKQAMIENLPKQRSLGQVFEEETNKAFLKEVSSKNDCPDSVQFDQQISQAVQQLSTEFGKR